MKKQKQIKKYEKSYITFSHILEYLLIGHKIFFKCLYIVLIY
jgi:hypothetical protein